MKEITLNSYGKINLSLEVINRREDGYHNLVTVMQEIDLKDEVTITKGEEFKITSNIKELPRGEENLVYKAWELLKPYKKTDTEVEIHIEKKIPMGAGLAGGSSNAGAVLKGLNQLWNLKLTEEELEKLGVKIGADVPFTIRGGTKLAKGIGNEFTFLPSLSNIDILLINPQINIRTEDVYKNLIIEETNLEKTEKLIKGIENRDLNLIGQNLTNSLESVVFKEYEIIKTLKEELKELGALGSLMSGSGSSVFGIFENERELEKAKKELKTKYPNYLILKVNTI